jgi:hypothetical protein
MSDINPREFGHLEGRVDALTSSVAAHAEAMKLMAKQLQTMNDTLTEARGGWKVMMWIGGGAGVIGAAVTWLAQHLTIKGP